MNIDLKKLRALLRTLSEGDVSEFEFEDKNTRLKLTRGPKVVAGTTAAYTVAAAPAGAPTPAAAAAEAAEDDDSEVITSPFVGTFYRAPSPDARGWPAPRSCC